jgi:subtilase family serine protease
MTVSVYLSLTHESQLQQLIHDIYTPGTAQYHHYLTPQQFHAQFSPSADTVNAVETFLSQNGLKVQSTPANHMYVDATGTVAQVEKAFGVTENQYTYKGKTLQANAQAPSIPSSLASAVTFIGGLDDSNQLIQPNIMTGQPDAPPGYGYATPGPCSTYYGDQTGTVSPAPTPYSGTLPWLPCGYTPAQMRAAYGLTSGNTGEGVTVGITDAFASPTIVDDVNRFSTHYGLPQLDSSNFTQIVVPGTYNFPASYLDPQGWYGEESLDVDWVHAMAPKAKIIYVGAQNNEVPLDHALEALIDSNKVNIVTNSWGWLGEPKQYGLRHADEFAFMQAAAQGISVLFSSGDNGDVAAYTGLAQGSWPATSPYVTAVGGTTLELKNSSGAKSEYGWGTYFSELMKNGGPAKSMTGTNWSPMPPEFFYGSGGGISLSYAQPDYQAGVVPNSLATSTTTSSGQTVNFSSPHRVTPDISMDADPNTGGLFGETYRISGNALVDQGCTQLSNQYEYCERRIGGTSLASPLFAGVLASVDQARFAKSESAVGFVNPALYALGSGSAAISDVTATNGAQGMLRNVGGTATTLTPTLRTVNSTVDSNGNVIEGADTSLRTTSGWDDVTGLGAPNVPALVSALS